MDIKTLQNMTLDDLLDIDISRLNKEEVAIVEKKLIKVANRRIARLKKSGKINLTKLTRKEKRGFSRYSPSPKVKNVRNKMVKNAVKVQEFLNKKTTKIREVDKQLERYKKMIRNTLGNSKMNITNRQAKRVSRLMEKAKEMLVNNDANKKLSGSPRLLQQVVDIVKSRKYIKNDEAEQIIQTAINKGYEESQELLRTLNEESKGSLDIGSNGNGFSPFD